MSKKTVVVLVIAVALVAAGAGAGTSWMLAARSGAASGSAGRRGGFPAPDGQGRWQSRPGAGGMMSRDGNMRAAMRDGGFAAGEVISKDAESFTVKMPDGGSRIVYFDDSTEFEKTVEASIADVSVGTTVTAFGTAGSSGITAQRISVTPQR